MRVAIVFLAVLVAAALASAQRHLGSLTLAEANRIRTIATYDNHVYTFSDATTGAIPVTKILATGAGTGFRITGGMTVPRTTGVRPYTSQTYGMIAHVGMRSDSGRIPLIVRVNLSSMVVLGTITQSSISSYSANADFEASDVSGIYGYFAANSAYTTGSYAFKINMASGTLVSSKAMATTYIRAVSCDATYCFYASWRNPARMYKVRNSDMSTIASTSFSSPYAYIWNSQIVSGYFYGGSDYSRVIKVSTSSLSRVGSVYLSGMNSFNQGEMVQDGSGNLHTSSWNQRPGRSWKVSQSLSVLGSEIYNCSTNYLDAAARVNGTSGLTNLAVWGSRGGSTTSTSTSAGYAILVDLSGTPIGSSRDCSAGSLLNAIVLALIAAVAMIAAL